jgi:hypothetical protein
MGVPGWPPQTYPRLFSNVAPRRDQFPLTRGNSNPGGPMNFSLVELLRLTLLSSLLGSTGNAVSYESAMSFGVSNPTVLKSLEGL